MATLEKELSATSAVQKITKSVKPPQLKPHEVRVKAEPVASPQFPFGEAAETYKSRYDIETKKETGVSFKGEAVQEEHLVLRKEGEAKVRYSANFCHFDFYLKKASLVCCFVLQFSTFTFC